MLSKLNQFKMQVLFHTHRYPSSGRTSVEVLEQMERGGFVHLYKI